MAAGDIEAQSMQPEWPMGRTDRCTSYPSLMDALNAFDACGYSEIFRTSQQGLCATHEGRIFPPSSLQVDQRARIEYDSNPDEEVLVFALSDPETHIKGTFTVTYGPSIDALDSETMQLLK